MQKTVALVVLVLLIAAGVWFTFFWGGDDEPIVPDSGGSGTVVEDNQVAKEAIDNGGSAVPVGDTVDREMVAVAATNLLDDPEIRAGLQGFRGRVLTHDEKPVKGCGVRFYRAAMDVILGQGVDVFADAPTLEPNYIGGESQTDEEGRFLVSGMWPRAMFIMFAGIGTDMPMHQVIAKTPSPGEIIDLGDIKLPNAGVIIGTVTDDDGEPLAGALVRAADVPGTLAGFFPVERFDPEGALLIREKNSPVNVLEMPPWVKRAFEHVPIPTTKTQADGSFRLVGVVPGSNMFAVTAKDHLSHMKPSVRVKPGQVKDVGNIGMRSGEELWGKVVDSKGEPIAEAEVLAGSTITMAPVDLARQVKKTNDKGEFSGLGFAPGKVTVAARRGPGHAWTLAEPQPILGDVVVTLPATYGAFVTVLGVDGQPVEEPRFKLLQGRAGDGTAEMAVFGFVPPVDLDDRLERTEEGPWHITNLKSGKYTLVVDAPGHATGFAGMQIGEEDASVSIELVAKREFRVRVVDHEDEPIRNAAIYADARGENLFEMPINCGRTKADGTLTIDRFQAEKLRVSADHPKWGFVHGEAILGEELLLRLLPPGSIEGLLTENGAPPEAGKYTVICEWRRNDGPRGPLEEIPRMITAGVDGKFRVAALQPGNYRLMTIPSLDALNSPGGMMTMFMSARMMGGNDNRVSVDVVSGQTATVQLDTGEKPIEGPTAHLFGSVMVDGRLSEGARVMAWCQSRRYTAEVDRAGRFDLGLVPAGHAWVNISEGGGLFRMTGQIWSGSFELKENEEKELRIEIMTSSIAGSVVDADGMPISGAAVQARGNIKGGVSTVHLYAPVDANGNFKFDKVAEGTWSLTVDGEGDEAQKGRVENIEVMAGVPITNLRIETRPAIQVSGRIDVAMFGNDKPRWAWISIHELKPDGSLGDQVDGIGLNMDDGDFSTDDIVPGQYGVRVHAGWESRNEQYRCQDLTVPPQGVSDLVLTGTKESKGQ
ncbi:MAG: carboxypeptidase-like regulatory domain-containing protein [bacterium]|nr:carboxypeptidase-like regulatory domain-containing protein [bacterium]